ncbi:MAG: MFS transporter [Thermoguttaceae bacterium]|nr:MFS transporter [Thermoguttaceae bacterium]
MTQSMGMPPGVRMRLSGMMFLQYMMLPVWWVPLATYLDRLGLEAWRPLVMSTMALGCLASPLIGMFADRHFASERVLAVLNVLTGVLLILAAQATSGIAVFFFIAILVHGLIFGFFFVGGQIYVDRRAPKEMRAQAQGFMFLMTFGVGLLIGNFVCDALINAYTVDGVRQWQPVWSWTTVASAVVLVLFAALFHFNLAGKKPETP